MVATTALVITNENTIFAASAIRTTAARMALRGIPMTKRSDNQRPPSTKLGWRSALAGSYAVGAISMFAGAAVQAQQPSASTADSLAEVIVTAERRSENVQNVPIAISAFTSETLQSRNLFDVTQIG